MLTLIVWSVCLFATEQKQIQLDLPGLNFELVKVFKAEYPSMIVQNLAIEQASNTNTKLGKFERIEISQGTIRQPNGMFSAVFSDGVRETRLFFRYKLTAQIEMVKASKDIQKDKLIEDGDVDVVATPFVGVREKLVQKDEVVGMESKRYIRAGGMIGPKDVTKRSIIKRGSTVSASMVDGGIELEFEVTSLEDASLGQALSVKGKNGKIYKAVAIAPSRVEIR